MMPDQSNDAVPPVLFDRNSISEIKERDVKEMTNLMNVFERRRWQFYLVFTHNLYLQVVQVSCVYVFSIVFLSPHLILLIVSGSYFVLDKDFTNIAVFKPKDEEPFAALNPKGFSFIVDNMLK
uniref:Transmembrane protein n=1 Tax=Heterorhabditis bacteriophora TaxID=37862 RepID=A0A1I7XN36_HETBA